MLIMYMSRKADRFLSEWKQDPDRKPLIIKGSRQVGKTETIRHFAAENYESVIEINFVEEPKYETITLDGYKAGDIIRNISLLDPSKRFIEGNTLIFFDELQKFLDIRCGIKLTVGNIGYSDNIYTFPYFCAFLLRRYLKENDLK